MCLIETIALIPPGCSKLSELVLIKGLLRTPYNLRYRMSAHNVRLGLGLRTAPALELT